MQSALVRLYFDAWHADAGIRTVERDHDRTSHLSSHVSDQTAEQLRAGNTAIFDELMREKFAPLVTFALGFVRDRATAEDVVQDVFTKLWEQRESLRITALTAYLYRAVRNHSLDITRGAAIRARLQEPLKSDVTAQLEAREKDAEDPRAQIVRTALTKLPERRRTVLRLRYEQELSYEEIAATLDLSVGGAQQLVFHAIRALRRQIGVAPEPPAHSVTPPPPAE